MASWEEDICNAIKDNDFKFFNSILKSKSVRKNGQLGRDEWKINYDPLHLAANLGRNVMVEMLVKCGANINSYTMGSAGSYTVLHSAVLSETYQSMTIKLILKLGANKKLKGNWYHLNGTSLEWSEQLGERREIIKILKGSLFEEVISTATNKIEKFITPKLYSLDERSSSQNHLVIENKSVTEELSNALRIRDQIVSLETEYEIINKEIEKLSLKSKKIINEVKSLKESSHYRTDCQIETLNSKASNEISTQNQQSSSNHECPVCFQSPIKIYSCVECENWLCQTCKSRVKKCPMCRTNFRDHPMRRNRAAEGFLNL